MGILDEAIREHLELKRQHGADDSELKQLEDDAFGPAERPGDEEGAADPFAEAPTEFMAAPEVGGEAPAEVAEEATSKRGAPDIAALQEAPEPSAEPAEAEPEASGPSTEEREVIADQPTEMFDVEAELRETLDRAPSDEELVEEEISEPRLAPVDPIAGIEDAEDEVAVEVSAPEPAPVEEEVEEEDDFWDEQRLSDELNQALEAPSEETEVVFEVEEEEEIVEVAEIEEEEADEEPPPPVHGDQDVLEDTPDFLEDSEDDQLWFEQKPPKDFDFDD